MLGFCYLEAHKLNKKEKSLSRGLLVPRCRSPPFLSEKQIDKKEMEETLWQKSITFMSEGKR